MTGTMVAAAINDTAMPTSDYTWPDTLPKQALAALTGKRDDGAPEDPPLDPTSPDWHLHELPTEIHADDQRTPDDWIPRHPALIRLTGRHPFNVEPPLPISMTKGFMTPVGLHFVRNHGAVPRLRWDQHSLTINGLVNTPRTFTMDQLAALPTHDVTCLLVCAGNRRKEQNMVKKTIGFNWGHSACSVSTWTGVRLCDILRLCNVQVDNDLAQYVCFRGVKDELPQGKDGSYGTSLTLAKAMDPANDILIAYRQNGRLLTPDHGYPVRIIIPGHIGGRMVKYLEEITVTPVESDNFYHYFDNRVLPSHVDAELAKKEGWWYNPDFIINDLNINSAIAFPQHNEVVPFTKPDGSPNTHYTVRGYAYSGGGRKIIRAEVSLDGGDSWRPADIQRFETPTKYGKHWCWVFWSVDVPLAELMRAPELCCRAWDSAMNTQPNVFSWNVMGMMNNCIFRSKIHPHAPPAGEQGPLGLRFEHPTVAGPTPGGWMDKSATEEEAAAVVAAAVPAAPAAVAVKPGVRMIPMEEVEKHVTRESCWFVHGGKVYDATPFLRDHPGGADSILLVAGQDATEEFDAIHSRKAKDMLKDYYIGELAPEGWTGEGSSSTSDDGTSLTADGASSDAATEDESSATTTVPLAPAALDPRKKLSLPLIEKHHLSHNVRRFRFALPTPEHRFGLPVGKHVFISARVNGELVMRAYTPSSSDDELGYFDLVVKVYFANEHPKFPEGGKMSQHLESLAIGDTIDVKGPLGHMEYVGKGRYLLDGEPRTTTHMSMIAGGTGITPMYQVIKDVLKRGDDVQIALLYANQSPDDILLREELDEMAKTHANFKVWYTVDRAPEGWEYSVGFIDEDMVRQHLYGGQEEGRVALLCGPPPMIKFACVPNLTKAGYSEEKIVVF